MSAAVRGPDDLEIERRRALASFWRGVAVVALVLPVALAPAWLPFSLGTGVAAHVDMSGTMQRTAELLGTTAGTLVGVAATWVLLSVGGLLFWFWRSGWLPRLRYLAHFKERVYVAACDAHLPGLRYSPDVGFSWRAFEKSKLFGFPVDVYRSENRFEGTWEGREVALVELHSQHQIESRSHGETQTTWVTHFRGFVLEVKLRERFAGTLRVVPQLVQKKEKLRKGWRTSAKPSGDADFDARFRLLSDRHVEAVVLLRQGLGSDLVRLAGSHPGLRLFLEGDRMLLLVPSPRSRFRPSLYRSARSDRHVEQFVENARAALRLVEIAP